MDHKKLSPSFSFQDLLSQEDIATYNKIKNHSPMLANDIPKMTSLILSMSNATKRICKIANDFYNKHTLKKISTRGPTYYWYKKFKEVTKDTLKNNLLKDLINIICEYIIPNSQLQFYPGCRFMLKDESTWREIECLKIHANQTVTIHFIGWTDKYDTVWSIRTLKRHVRIINNDLFEIQSLYYKKPSMEQALSQAWDDSISGVLRAYDFCDDLWKIEIIDSKIAHDLPYIYIHYKAFDNKYDHWICLWSKRICFIATDTKKNDTLVTPKR
jgi:hypothetical protein